MLPLPITSVGIQETSISPPVLKPVSDTLLHGRAVQATALPFPSSSRGALFRDLLRFLLSLAPLTKPSSPEVSLPLPQPRTAHHS